VDTVTGRPNLVGRTGPSCRNRPCSCRR